VDAKVGTEQGLRVLAADEDRDALRATVALLEELGHQVTALAVGVGEAAQQILAEDPDVAVVVLHDDPQHALELIDELTAWASGPVIALVPRYDAAFASAAAERGIDALARPGSAADVQAAIEVALRRAGERRALTQQVDQLETAMQRRSTIERAKGILMERHGVDERGAFELLRAHARSRSESVVAVAQAVSDGHALLPGT
jgi:AmiR/NasT family two-component response regulator